MRPVSLIGKLDTRSLKIRINQHLIHEKFRLPKYYILLIGFGVTRTSVRFPR